MLLFFIR